jgi:hypothetical protein
MGLVIRAFGQFVGARAFSVLQYLSRTWRASYNKTRTPRIRLRKFSGRWSSGSGPRVVRALG